MSGHCGESVSLAATRIGALSARGFAAGAPLRVTARLALLVPLLLAADGAEEVEGWIRKGNAAFGRDELATACACYEKAQRLTIDPGLVAFNLATAKYHLARSGQSSALSEAEVGYRSCLGITDPRRARALFGLGNCLLLRGGAGKLDRLALRSAIDRYSECLQDPTCDDSLAGDARYNLGRARLLLLQAPVPAQETQEPSTDEEGPKKEPEDQGMGSERQPRSGHERNGEPNQARGATGKDTSREGSQGKTGPGRGLMTPLPEAPDAPPVARPDALLHLEQASRRIAEDRLVHRRTRVRTVPAGVQDW